MIDKKTIRRQRTGIIFFFVSFAVFILCLFLFFQSVDILASQIQPFSTCEGMNPDAEGSVSAETDGTEAETSAESESAESESAPASSGTRFTSSQIYKTYRSILEKIIEPVILLGLVSFVVCVVSFFVFRIPKAFSILHQAKLQKSLPEHGDEMPISPEDLDGHTLRPGGKTWDSQPQGRAAQDFGSLFETTARIYDGNEITASVPEESGDANPGNFSILEDLHFLGSDERVF